MKTNDKNKYKDFGDRLSLIMYKQNISNIQLANAMFVSPSTPHSADTVPVVVLRPLRILQPSCRF